MSVLNIAPKNLASLLLASFALLSVACAGSDESPQYTATDIDGTLTGSSTQALRCESGAVQSCTIWLGQHGDLNNCVKGVEVCAQGEWTGCMDEATLADDPDMYASLAE
jgi:hypothetical protein